MLKLWANCTSKIVLILYLCAYASTSLVESNSNNNSKGAGKINIQLHPATFTKFKAVKFTTLDLRRKTQTGLTFTKDKSLSRKIHYDGTQYLRVSVKNSRFGMWKKLADFRLSGRQMNYSCQFKLNSYANGPIELATRGCPLYIPGKKFIHKSDLKIIGATTKSSDKHKMLVEINPQSFRNFKRIWVSPIDNRGKKKSTRTFKQSQNKHKFIKSSTHWLRVVAGYKPGLYKTIGHLNVGLSGDNSDRIGNKCMLTINKNPGWGWLNKKPVGKAAASWFLSNNINLPALKKLTKSNFHKVSVSLKGSNPNCRFVPLYQLETIVYPHDYKGQNDMVKLTVDDESFDAYKDIAIRSVLMNGDVVKSQDLTLKNNTPKTFKLPMGSRLEIGYEAPGGTSTYLHRFGSVIPFFPTLTISHTKNEYFAYVMAPYGKGKTKCNIKVLKGPGWHIGATMGQIIIEKSGPCLVKRLFDDVRIYEDKNGKSKHMPQVLIIDKNTNNGDTDSDNTKKPWQTPSNSRNDYGYGNDYGREEGFGNQSDSMNGEHSSSQPESSYSGSLTGEYDTSSSYDEYYNSGFSEEE